MSTEAVQQFVENAEPGDTESRTTRARMLFADDNEMDLYDELEQDSAMALLADRRENGPDIRFFD